jgi:predicted ATPase/class 3 adenylate cyclase
MTDQEQLEQAIMALENQRAVLGDKVVDAALASMRDKLSALIEAQTASQQRKLATVLFMDIVGSTSITQHLDPEDTMTIMETALQRLANPVYAHGGRVTRFMGDGFLALFGAPVARENEPEMGVRAGLQILAEAKVFAREVEAQWHIPDFNIRVGISTGLVIIGGDTEAENTIMGTTVNLAARLENAAMPGTLLICHHTYQFIHDLFDLQRMEPIKVKGFAEPCQVYRVLQAKLPAFRMSMRSVAGIETSMVGRDVELLMLQNMFRDATEDAEVHVVTVVGEAGVGKSRLLYEFEKWIERLPEASRYFKGRATAETETMPYGLIRRIFIHYFEILESDSAEEVREKFCARMAPTLDSDQAALVGQMLGFDFSASQAVQSQLGSETFRELATAHLAKYLRVITSEPAVILLEDIHWADDSSLDLLGHLVTVIPNTRLLVVCLARSPLFERRPSWGEGQEFHTHIHLKPLSRRASRALVGEILQKAESIPADLYDLIVEGAEGNPFYVEELIKMLIEDGVIVPGKISEDHWQIEMERLAEVRVPLTLTGILQARLDCLPPEEKTVLQRAAVVGRLFWGALVAELASDKVQAAQVKLLLEDVRKRELIFRREYSAFDATDEYIFKHALLRDVTYETVLLKLRRVYHAQVARWLESTSGERISEYLSLIARHYELAGETTKAVDFLRRLGEESLQVCAFHEAVRAFERALTLLPAIDHDQVQGGSTALTNADLAERAILLVNLGNLYNRVGDYLKAIQHLEQGLDLARQANDPQAEISALNRLAQVASERGTYDKAQSYLDEVLVLAREQGDQTCVASTLSMLGSIAWKWGDLVKAEKCCHESLVIYRELDNRNRISKILNILGILATLQENFEQAEQYYEQGLSIAREIDNRLLVADLLNNLGYLNHHSTQNLEKAKRYYQESLPIAREIDHRSGATSTLVNLGQLNILLGEQQAALNYLREALIESVAIGAVPLTLDALIGVAQQQIEVGQHVSAAELLGLALNHPALEMDVCKVAELVLDRLRDELPTEQLEAAMERGKMLELDEAVAELQARIAKPLGDSVE